MVFDLLCNITAFIVYIYTLLYIFHLDQAVNSSAKIWYMAGYFIISNIAFQLISQSGAELIVIWCIWSVCCVDMVYKKIPRQSIYALIILWVFQHAPSFFTSTIYSYLTSSLILLLIFSTVYGISRWQRGTPGIGFGDVRLAGSLGLWFPLQSIPLFLLLSSVCAITYYILGLSITKKNMRFIPFGPFMCAAAIMVST